MNGTDPTGKIRDLWDGDGPACYMCGGGGMGGAGGSISYSAAGSVDEIQSPNGLGTSGAADEAAYAAGVARTEDAAATAKAANQALAAGNPVLAGFLAAGNSNVAAVPVAPNTPDPTYNAFAVAAAMLGLNPNASVQVLAQERGVATSVQLTPLASFVPYQMDDLAVNLSNIGTSDPSVISFLYHGAGNPFWYVGDSTDAAHVVDITTPLLPGSNNPFQVGLQLHVDAYNPAASVVTFFQHIFTEVLPGRGIVGQPNTFFLFS